VFEGMSLHVARLASRQFKVAGARAAGGDQNLTSQFNFNSIKTQAPRVFTLQDDSVRDLLTVWSARLANLTEFKAIMLYVLSNC
jgi:hypothetical protein